MRSDRRFFIAPRLKPISAKRSAVVAVLDVGTSKIACAIGRLRPVEGREVLAGRSHSVDILGLGLHRSQGIKAGFVVDMDAAEQAIRMAVDAAERMAGVAVESVILNVGCGRLGSEVFSAAVATSGEAVEDDDLQRVLTAGTAHSVRDSRTVLHALPIGYAIDEERGIRDPRGMVGERLGVDMHVVSAETAPLRNLILCVERCHLAVEALVATPYASGMAALVEDETELGVACIDMGGGTTSVAVFLEGRLVHADAFAVGGNHVTLDLARGLSTRLSTAERIKALHGNVLSGEFDGHDTIAVAPPGEEDAEGAPHVSRDRVNRIVRARAEEILELARDRLAANGFAGRAARRIVLTGGSSQLTGIAELARQIIGRQVRLGRPLGMSGLPETAKGPAFAAVCGMLVYPQVAHLEHVDPTRVLSSASGPAGGYLARVGQWIRESF